MRINKYIIPSQIICIIRYLGCASVWQSIVTSVPHGAPTSWFGTQIIGETETGINKGMILCDSIFLSFQAQQTIQQIHLPVQLQACETEDETSLTCNQKMKRYFPNIKKKQTKKNRCHYFTWEYVFLISVGNWKFSFSYFIIFFKKKKEEKSRA